MMDDPVEACVSEGIALYGDGDIAGATLKFGAALVLAPAHARANYNLGVILHAAGRLENAIAHYERAIETQPDWTAALVNLGNVRKDMGDLEGASRHYQRALEIDPEDMSALHNLGAICFTRGDNSAARGLYERVLTRNPGEPRTLYNLGILELHDGAIERARRRFERAIETWPEYVDPRYGLGLCALAEQDFATGWDNYELRFRTDPPESTLNSLPLPWLNLNEPHQGTRVAVRAEQGIGDQILYSTLLPELLEAGVSAVCEVDPRLIEAYRSSLPGLELVPPRDPLIEACDAQIPLASLPRLFRRTPESFTAQPAALIRAAPGRVQGVREALGNVSPVGIAWRSVQPALQTHVAQRKSAALGCFAPFAEAGLHLLDLQYGDVENERIEFDRRYPGLRVEVPGLDRFRDLEGMLAAIEACHLVITTSNVTAHLAGVIGKRTWLVYLGNAPPFHYWVRGTNGRSLWYPSVEIFTSSSWTRWEQAFGAMAEHYLAAGV